MRGERLQLREDHDALARKDQSAHLDPACQRNRVCRLGEDVFDDTAVTLRTHVAMQIAHRCERGDFLRAFALETRAAVEQQAFCVQTRFLQV